jgi:hypothetical protein
MAAVAASGTPSLASVTPPQNCQIPGLYAGEAITAGAPCYIKAADGKVWLSNGTSANAAAKVRGWAAAAAAVGEPVTLLFDVVFRYGSGMTPGADLFVATSAGTLVDAATTGGTAPVGFVVDATRIRVWQSRY